MASYLQAVGAEGDGPMDGAPSSSSGTASRDVFRRSSAEYAKIQDELWMYGFRVLKDALRTGRIINMCSDAGVPIFMTEEQRRTLHSSIEDRDALAVDTLLRAVPYFRSKVLEGHRWDPKKSSMQTFFVGCCLRVFRDVFPRWAHARKERLGELGFGLSEATLDGQLSGPSTPDPEGAAALRDTLRTIMKYARPEARMICLLILQDLTYAEIGEKLDGLSSRAIEGHMRRLRRTVQRLARRGQIELPVASNRQFTQPEVA